MSSTTAEPTPAPNTLVHERLLDLAVAEPDALAQAVVDAALQCCGAAAAGLAWRLPQGMAPAFRLLSQAGHGAGVTGAGMVDVEALCSAVAASGGLVLWPPAQRQVPPAVGDGCPASLLPGANALLAVQCPATGRTEGVLWVAGVDPDNHFTTGHLHSLQGLARFAALACRHQQAGRALQAGPDRLQTGANMLPQVPSAAGRQAQDTEQRWPQLSAPGRAALAAGLSGDAAFVIGADLRYVAAEGEALQRLGLVGQSLVGKTVAEVMGSDQARRLEPLLLQALAGTPFDTDHDMHGRSFVCRGRPTRGAQGQVEAVLCMLYDITERKQAELAVQRSAAVFQALVRNSPLGIYLVDAELRMFEISRGAAAAFAAVQPVLGRSLAEVMHIVWPEPFATEVIARFCHTLATGEPYASTTQSPRADIGAVQAYEWHLDRVDLPNGTQGVVCYFYDLSERQRLLASVQDSEARLRAVQDSAVDGMMLLEPVRDAAGAIVDFRWLQANHAAGVIVGRPAQWFVGRRMLQEMPGNRDAGLFEGYVRVLEGGAPWSTEFTYSHDGLDLYLRLVAVRAGAHLAVSFTDLTEKRRAELLLRQSEDRLRIALQAANAGAFDWNIDTGELFWSEGHFSLLGLEPGCVVPTYALWRQHVHPDDLARVEHQVQAAMQAGARFECEYRLNAADGQLRHVQGNGLFLAQPGQPRRMVGAMVDVSALKRAEAVARANERRFRVLAEGIPVALWVTDPQAKVEYVNREYCDFFGVSLDRVQQEGWQPLIHPDDAPRYVDAFRAAVDRRGRFRSRARVRHACGDWRWIDSIGVPRFADDGSFLGFVGLSPDVTAEVVSAQALRDASQAKDQFLATLSHELRNPLTPIRTAAALLGTPDLDAQRVQWAQQIIGRQVAQMARLLDDLLDISRITQGKLQLQRTRVALSSVIDTAVETARPVIDRKGHTLTVTLPSGMPEIDADAVRLSQVVANLLNNAAKFTDDGGQLALLATVEGGVLVLRVRDNGAGLEPAAMGRLFTMFTQLDHTVGRSEGGLGVGLALVKALVEMHGGTVEVASAGTGEGSEFTVRLPVLVAARAAEPLLPAGGQTAATGARVLVVDDNSDAADTLGWVLELAGHEVKTAYSGQDALRLAAGFQPDVAVLDIGMPQMDGYELARTLRSARPAAAPFLIALTGWGQDGDKEAAERAGFDLHLTKPVDPAQLLPILAGAPRRGTGTAPPGS